MNNFIIEKAFLDYLKMVKLDINSMSAIQIKETQSAFFAGCGYMFRTLESTSNLPTEDKAIFVYKNFENQIEEFFKEEVIKQSKINHYAI